MGRKNIVIIGCSNSGAFIATEYEKLGYYVYIIDRSEQSFNKLDYNFGGVKLAINVGEAINFIDKIPNTIDLCVVLTHDEEQNILIALAFKHYFSCKQIVTRISDVNKEFILEQAGIKNVNTTKVMFQKINDFMED